ncbi:MAG: hypothetical protein DRO04_00190 [Candidatus Iainarchaeum archaeon]|uniref:ATP-cone domain-containing protein n=1 Tax=Candidatus Iainarchaeum sp. TaxID=3101447 RepID=A0A497JJM4_9ARCH|nr:MAG: hypothetical protein DRO04_00190 [Candidatus Diapherotrites archaeon]
MQPISASLAKIAKECEEAGASQFEILKILKELEKEQDLNLDRLRSKATEILRRINPKAAQVYESFTRMKVFTSEEKIKPFDMGNIVKSLLKETRLQRSLAQKIGTEVEEKLKDLKIEFLNTPLIRELANVKLLEYGKEKVHFEYCRHGMPVYDIKEKLQKEQFLNFEILKEYHLYSFLPKRVVEEYFGRSIFIEGVEFFSNNFFSYNINIVEDNFEELILATLEKLNSIADHATYCGISNVNLSIAHALQSEKNVEEKIKFYISLLKQFISAAKKNIVLNISLNPTRQPFTDLKSSFISRITNLLFKLLPEEFKTALIIDRLSQLKEIKYKPNYILLSRKEEFYGYLPSERPILASFALRLENNADANLERAELLNKALQLKKEALQSREYLQEFDFECFDSYVQILGTKFLDDDIAERLNKNFKIINCIGDKALAHFSAMPEKRIYNLQKYISVTKKLPNKEFYCAKLI